MKDVVSLIERAMAEPSSENLEAMWRHVIRLSAWYLLPAQLDGPTTPLVAQLDDGNWVVAFTHLRTLNQFTRDHDMQSEQGDVPMLALPPGEAVERVQAFAEHVEGIVFNPGGPLAFRAPTAALGDFASRFARVLEY